MRHFHIIFSEVALNNFHAIADYIEKDLHAPLTAEKFYDGFLQAVSVLSYAAESFALFDRKPNFGKTTRRII